MRALGTTKKGIASDSLEPVTTSYLFLCATHPRIIKSGTATLMKGKASANVRPTAKLSKAPMVIITAVKKSHRICYLPQGVKHDG
jgi:hypothetical protein